MFQSCYWLSIAFTTDGGCPSAEWHWFRSAEQFQNANVALETFRFRKVSPFLIVSSLFGLEHLILPVAAVSKRTIVCPAGVFLQHVAYLEWCCPGWFGTILGISWPCRRYRSRASLLQVSVCFCLSLVDLQFCLAGIYRHLMFLSFEGCHPLLVTFLIHPLIRHHTLLLTLFRHLIRSLRSFAIHAVFASITFVSNLLPVRCMLIRWFRVRTGMVLCLFCVGWRWIRWR